VWKQAGYYISQGVYCGPKGGMATLYKFTNKPYEKDGYTDMTTFVHTIED
jgi:hypothetical protein